MKPTVPLVAPLVLALYSRDSAGCCLHCSLDDGNVDNKTVQWELDNAKHDDCRHLASLMLRMSKTQRRKLASLAP